MAIHLGSCFRDGVRDFARAPLLHSVAAVFFLLVSMLSLGVLTGPLIVGHQVATGRSRRGEPGTYAGLFAGFDRQRFLPAMIAGIGITFLFVVSLLFLVLPSFFTMPLFVLGLLPIAASQRDGMAALAHGIATLRRAPFAIAGATQVILIPFSLLNLGLVVFQPDAFGPLATEVLALIAPEDPQVRQIGAIACYVLLLPILPMTLGALQTLAEQAEA